MTRKFEERSITLRMRLGFKDRLNKLLEEKGMLEIKGAFSYHLNQAIEEYLTRNGQ